METLFETHPIMLYIWWIVVVLFLFNLIDMLHDYFTETHRDWKDTWVNILIDIWKQVLSKTFIWFIWIVILSVISSFIPWWIPMNIYTWITAFILADFSYYWLHRIEHEHSFLWALHWVHHSSESYNLSTANRLSWFEDLIEWIFLIPMVLLWFNVFQIIAALILVALYQHLLHTEKVNKLWFLELFLNTPSHHRVHHGANKKYLDKNYSGVFIIWDRLFGTFQVEDEKVQYGLTVGINTYNPFLVNVIEFKNIYYNVQKCDNYWDKMKIIFGKTGWKPDYLKKDKQWNEQNKTKK